MLALAARGTVFRMASAAVASAKPLPASFDERYMRRRFRPNSRPNGVYAWDLERVRAARDAQCTGNYRSSADLAEAVKTDPAVFSALLNRLAPHRGLPIDFEGAREKPRKEAAALLSQAVPFGVMADGFERQAMLGEAVMQVIWTARPDGSRIEPILEPWPMQSVYNDRHTGKLRALTTDGFVDIVHGDGKWIVWRLHASEPWHWGAVKALALVWADRAFGVRDRSLSAEAHGIAKPIGELPKDVKLDSPAGLAFKEFVEELYHSKSGGVVPNGAIVKLLESAGQGWQIFRELIEGDSKDIARILLGQDGSMVNEGGNYIKAAMLYGVRNDIVEGDLGAAAYALNTGLWRPWAALNFGTPEAAPRMRWLFPDADEDARRTSLAEHTTAFHAALRDYRANRFKVDQAFVDRLAQRFGVEAPEIEDEEPKPVAPAAAAPTGESGPGDGDDGEESDDAAAGAAAAGSEG